MDIQKIIEDFEYLAEWEERYRYIIELGQQLSGLEDSEKIEAHRVLGCMSQTWLIPSSSDDGKILHFRADSEAYIVRGLVAIVLAVYSGKAAEEILKIDIMEILGRLGFNEHLSFGRRNGLQSLVDKVLLFARSHQ